MKNKIIITIIIFISAIIFIVLKPIIQERQRIKILENELITIQQSIENNDSEISRYGAMFDACTNNQTERHNQANTLRDNNNLLKDKKIVIQELLGIEVVQDEEEIIEIEDSNDLTGVIYDESGIWRVNGEGKRHKLYNLEGVTVEDRILSLLNKFGIGNTYQSWFEYGSKHFIKPEVAVCIAFADTSLGAQTKTTNNIGNIGNNDRGDRVYFNTLDGGIEAIYKTLNNNYLGKYGKIGMLSQGGRTVLGAKGCGEKGEYCYATSPENRTNNVINCLNLLYWHQEMTIDENFVFRGMINVN